MSQREPQGSGWHRGPHEASRGCLHEAHAVPASCAGGKAMLPPSPTVLICLYFWPPSFLHVSWDHSCCHLQPLLSSAHGIPISLLLHGKEGCKSTDTLQIKFHPGQSRQLSEALGYRNWLEVVLLQLSHVCSGQHKHPLLPAQWGKCRGSAVWLPKPGSALRAMSPNSSDAASPADWRKL